MQYFVPHPWSNGLFKVNQNLPPTLGRGLPPSDAPSLEGRLDGEEGWG